MSKEIAAILGRTEYPEGGASRYRSSLLLVSAFNGGEKNGTMLQLAIGTIADDNIQFTKENATELAMVLNKWIIRSNKAEFIQQLISEEVISSEDIAAWAKTTPNLELVDHWDGDWDGE
jgi:phage terminase large subunit-like protein